MYVTGYHFSGSFSVNLEMSGNSTKVGEMLGKRPTVREMSGNLCIQGNLIVATELVRQIAELKSVK